MSTTLVTAVVTTMFIVGTIVAIGGGSKEVEEAGLDVVDILV